MFTSHRSIYCSLLSLVAATAFGGTITVEKPGIFYLAGTGDGVTENSSYPGGVVLGDSINETLNVTWRMHLPPPVVGAATLTSVRVWIYGSAGMFGGPTLVTVGNDPVNHSAAIGATAGWHLIGSYTGDMARTVVTDAGDGIGSRLDVVLALQGWAQFFDVKAVKVEAVMDPADTIGLEQFQNVYAAWRGMAAYGTWHGTSWTGLSWSSAFMSEGFRSCMEWLSEAPYSAAMTLDGYPLSYALLKRARDSIAAMPFVPSGAMDMAAFNLHYFGAPLPADVVSDCAQAATSFGGWASTWLRVACRVDGGEATSLMNDAIVSSTENLYEVRSDLTRCMGSPYYGIAPIYQARGAGVPGSSGQGDQTAEALMVAMRGMLWWDFAIGQTPSVSNENSPYEYMRGAINAHMSDIASLDVAMQPADAGIVFTVDGRSYTNGHVFYWLKGTSHTISVPPVSGTRQFSFWSDGAALADRAYVVADNRSLTSIYRETAPVATTILADRDTFVWEQTPAASYGSSDNMMVMSGTGSQALALVHFDLSALPPGTSVDSAELRLFLYAGMAGGQVETHRATSAWSETTPWVFRPSYDATVMGTIDGPSAEGGTWSWGSGLFPSLRSTVQQWVDTPAANFGFCLRTIQPRGRAFCTREMPTAALRPALIVQHAAPAPAVLTGQIEPSEIASLAMWRLAGNGTDTNWHTSGQSAVGATAGSGTVNYYPLNGWTAPSAQAVSLVAGFNTVTGRYVFAASAPAGVTASDAAYTDHVQVQWTAPAVGGLVYEVWRNTANNLAEAIQVSPPTLTATTFDDYSVDRRLRYYYWVRAVTSVGATAFGGPDLGSAIRIAPAQAVNPRPVDGATMQPQRPLLQWDDGGGADEYDVYLGISTSPIPWRVRTTSTSYDPGTLGLDFLYYWRVDARNSAGVTTGRVWTFRTAQGTVATPTLSRAPGVSAEPFNLTVACSTASAIIHYTTNGLAPAESDPIVANNGTVRIGRTTTFYAKAWRTGWAASAATGGVYTVRTPRIRLTAPAGTGTVVRTGTPIRIAADAAADDGLVRVDFLANGGTIGSAVAAPYEMNWTNAAAGMWVLQAIVFDALGNSATSETAQVSVVPPETRYVLPSGGHRSPFTSWANAARDLQSAVNVSFDGDTIIVGDGMYRVSSEIVVTKGVRIVSVNGPEASQFDAAYLTRLIRITHPRTVVEGLGFLRGGTAEPGGGAYLAQGTLSNCIFNGCNTWGGPGGGVYVITGSVVQCTVVSNWSRGGGGGVWIGPAGQVREGFFGYNSSTNGGGVLSVGGRVTGVEFRGNAANLNGGGVQSLGGTVERCAFYANWAAALGGGVYASNATVRSSVWLGGNSCGVYGGGLAAIVSQVDGGIFSLCWSKLGGGAVYEVGSVVRNLVMTDSNSTSGNGAGSWNEGGIMENCTISGNYANGAGGGLYARNGARVSNTIIYFNGAATNPDLALGDARTVFNNTCCSVVLPGTGNLAQDPGFIAGPSANLRLKVASACANAGLNAAWMAGATDAGGLARILEGTVDIGAYESSGGTYPPFGGAARTLPGVVEAEDFDEGGEDVAYHDTTAANEGEAYRILEGVDILRDSAAGNGHAVSWTRAGEWLDYAVDVAADGFYTLEFQVATDEEGGALHAELDGSALTDPLIVPVTGGRDVWQPVVKTGVWLPSGRHSLRVIFDAAGRSGLAPEFDFLRVSADAPPTSGSYVQFSGSRFSASESDGVVTVRVERAGSAIGTVAVDWYTTDGSAFAGGDFESSSGTLTWDDGDLSTKTILIPLYDDPIGESEEWFEVALAPPVGADLGEPATARAVIVNDDAIGPGRLQFVQGGYLAPESVGTVTLMVARVNGAQGTVSVQYGTANGSAAARSDYVATGGILTWGDADIAPKPIVVTIIDDIAREGDEYFLVRLLSPVGGSLGSPADAALIIPANDLPAVDLDVADVTWSPATPVQGRAFTAYVTVRNRGTVAANGGYVDVWANRAAPIPVGTRGDRNAAVGTVSAGQSKVIPVTGLTAPSPAGSYSITAFVDSLRTLTETNEDNNVMTKSYEVSETRPDFVVTMVSATYAAGVLTYAADVRNQGLAAGDAGTLGILPDVVVDGATVLTHTPGVINPGQTVRITGTWRPATALPRGAHYVTGVADRNGDTTEQDETNNMGWRAYIVP